MTIAVLLPMSTIDPPTIKNAPRLTFPITSVVIAFVTPMGDKRAMQMKLWCEEQLVSSPVYRTT